MLLHVCPFHSSLFIFSIVTFFKTMTMLQEEQRLSSAVKKSVLAVKQKYCITVALFKKFEK